MLHFVDLMLFLIGLELWELDLKTGSQTGNPQPARVESAARSERAVYSWLSAISSGAQASAAALGDEISAAVFCGSNRTDEENPARCGLACAPELGFATPLADLTVDEVSMLAQVCHSNVCGDVQIHTHVVGIKWEQRLWKVVGVCNGGCM